MGPFHRGMEVILSGREAVPVIPVALDNLWGSNFTRSGGHFFRKWPVGFRRTVVISFGPPVPAPPNRLQDPPRRPGGVRLASKATENASPFLRDDRPHPPPPRSPRIRPPGPPRRRISTSPASIRPARSPGRSASRCRGWRSGRSMTKTDLSARMPKGDWSAVLSRSRRLAGYGMAGGAWTARDSFAYRDSMSGLWRPPFRGQDGTRSRCPSSDEPITTASLAAHRPGG